ncbi:MAG: AgmX/PglI C-terminal domain-containing protein [Deltaproteobacteria bacterium]|nr:AgmX/PglI C-terminal domain-containing protein [Deltaproteobacteria bacterium]
MNWEKLSPSFNICYRQALGKQPGLKGKVVFKMFIDSAGGVTKVHPDKGIKKKNEFKRCMLQELKKLRFPVSKEGKNSIVLITFLLK